jgi:acyl-CoA dehydrogenase
MALGGSHRQETCSMDLRQTDRARALRDELGDFMVHAVLPSESTYLEQRASLRAAGHPNTLPPVVEDLKVQARQRGLWNLFLPAVSGLLNAEYAVLAEQTGWSVEIAPEALNCSAPDTGNMEVLERFGTQEQQARWLAPLLEGEIRSAFAMTEPDVASSDATNIRTRIERDGPNYVINGRKWWTTGVADPRCAVLIVMGKSNPDGLKHRQQSMVLVPLDTSGVVVERILPVFGYRDQHGHGELSFTDVRVPAENLIGEEGGGFAIAQARLGPGRIHHCMRAIGMAERAIALAIERARSRTVFGATIAEQPTFHAELAEHRMAIEQARLLVLKTAWLIDEVGAQLARSEIAAIKVVVPRAVTAAIDWAIQVHGGAGVGDDTPLPEMWAYARTLRIADGPDAVHIQTVARQELRRASMDPWTPGVPSQKSQTSLNQI